LLILCNGRTDRGRNFLNAWHTGYEKEAVEEVRHEALPDSPFRLDGRGLSTPVYTVNCSVAPDWRGPSEGRRLVDVSAAFTPRNC
jgi:hypothetical protein